jgi:hypothetical protein
MKYRVTKVYRIWEECVVEADDEEAAIELADAEGEFTAVHGDLLDMQVEQE